MENVLQVKVATRKELAEGIASYELAPADEAVLPDF